MQTVPVPTLVVGFIVLMSADANSDAFEWAGIFELPETHYLWTSQKVNGNYADASMKLVAIPVASATENALHGAEADGITSLRLACTDVQHGGVITPANSTCYKLHFHQAMWQSLFRIDASNAASVAFFTEHVPTEFEATAHYLKDSSGEDIEPAAELPEPPSQESAKASDEDKPWGEVIGASILVNLITLVGVILAIPAVMKAAATHITAFQGILNGFAAGCIIAAAVFLLMFEATHLVGAGWKEEVDVLWRWGTCILVGFELPSIIDFISSVVASNLVPTQDANQVTVVVVTTSVMPTAEDANDRVDDETQKPSLNSKIRILAGVLIGDFFHNLCDGIFIGAAFKGCGKGFGWSVTLSTVLHELPQELADYFILTSPGAMLGPVLALVLNFVSGMSVLLGGIIVLASDPDDSDVGMLLAFGAGVYLHIGAVECMPKIYEAKLSAWLRAACVLAFIVGSVLIGLILLDHEHCVPAPEGASPPSGGGHHHR